VTILVVRTDLYLTNYPQVGGHGLHIAHLLWGGLLMVLSLGLVLAFVASSARQLAAVIGGVGFGLFIDEVGKFVTADNNYFFKPAAAIIYCVFIVLFVIVRQLDAARAFTKREYLLNTIELVKEVPLQRMGAERRAHALALLSRADQSDPLVPALRQMLDDPRALHPRPQWPARRLAARVRARLLGAVDRPGFEPVVITLLSVWVLALIVQIVGLTWFTTPYENPQEVFRLGSHITNVPLSSDERGFVRAALLVSTIAAVLCALLGLLQIVRGQRRTAFAWLERALLVSIFFTQVFAFAHSQFIAAIGLGIDLGLFVAVRALLVQEQERAT
jgi:hypothetical protein